MSRTRLCLLLMIVSVALATLGMGLLFLLRTPRVEAPPVNQAPRSVAQSPAPAPMLPTPTPEAKQKNVVVEEKERLGEWSVATMKQAIDSQQPPVPLSLVQAGEFLVGRWLRETDDAQEIADWLDARGDQLDLDRARVMLAVDWVKFDPEAMVAWVETLPPGPGRDECVDVTSRDLVPLQQGGLEMAYRLAVLPDAAGMPRKEAIRNVLTFMNRKDPKNRIALIEQSALPAEEKRQAIEILMRAEGRTPEP